MASAAISILLWGILIGIPRIIILCTDNMSVSKWFVSSKSHGLVTWPLLMGILHWRIDMCVGIIPRYVRIARNISADGLTRWSQNECDMWMYAQEIQMVALPGLWEKRECERGQRMGFPLSAFEIMAPPYHFYLTYRLRVVGRRSELYSTTRILNEHHIPTKTLSREIGTCSVTFPNRFRDIYVGISSF